MKVVSVSRGKKSSWRAGLRLTVDETVTSGLGANQRTTPAAALASENALPSASLGAVCAKHPTNLTRRDTNVTSGHIRVGANVLAQLAHEGNAKLANLIVRLALGVEVGTTLSTTHGHCVDLSLASSSSYSSSLQCKECNVIGRG